MPGTSHPIQTSGSDERPECEDRLAAQREALEEMSQQLLDKLNVMVEEQEARAQEFAQRVHSSYQLSEQGEWRTPTSAPKGKIPPAPTQGREVSQTLPPRRESVASKLREKTTSLSRSTKAWLENGMEIPSEKSDNKGCLFFAIVIFIIYIIFQFL